ncbi:MAG: hypothetical protein R2780_00345 [Crocinitomicaceae bacterium]|nr:hypothetical protein [Crocinitomicaceae bacterium]
MSVRSIIFFSSLFFIYACDAPEKESEGEIREYSDEPIPDEEQKPSDFGEDDPEGTDSKHVLYCEIGLYEKPAIMVLDWMTRDENGVYPIKGYYFYIDHQKNLDLEGFSDPSTRGIYLTESYKGKKTGYMEFAQDVPWEGENYWAASKGNSDKQTFYSEDLMFRDNMGAQVDIQKGQYTNPHTITIYMGDEEGEVEESVTDELNWVIINQEFFAFDISTTGRNAHTGEASGLATIKGNKAIWISDSEEHCKLTFDLSKKESSIEVSEENCEYYHGAHASFDWNFSK